MSALALLVALLSTNATFAAKTYEDAYQAFQQDNRPMVILVGADWCPACRTMKTARMPEAWRRGSLKNVSFTVVDVDQRGQLARRLMRGGSIPQLIMYYKTPAGVQRRMQLTGAQSPEAIERFVTAAFQQPSAGALSSTQP